MYDAGAIFPDPDVVSTLTHASLTGHRVWMRYSSWSSDETAREVDPYGVVALYGRWYLHGFCHLRQDRRTFRVDRIRRVDLLPATFERPEEIDPLAAVEASLALSRGWRVAVMVHAPIAEVRPHVRSAVGVLERDGPDRTLLRASTDDADWFAWRLMAVPFEMTVLEPPELREAFGRIGERMRRVAERVEVTR